MAFKGQLISKRIFSVFNSSKKMNENNATWGNEKIRPIL